MSNQSPSAKSSAYEKDRVARVAAVQAVYQMTSLEENIDVILAQFLVERFKTDYPHKVNTELFQHLVRDWDHHREEIDESIKELLAEGWTIESLDTVLLSILRVGITELKTQQLRKPHGVIISEYVDVAKGFYGEDEPGFVNGLLDAYHKKNQA